MATYSPELLAALRQRYEDTDQPMSAIADEFEIGITTLQTLVRKNGWSPRSQRLRGCPPALRRVEEAQALPDTQPLQEMPALQAIPASTVPLTGVGSEAVAGAAALPPPLPAPERGAETRTTPPPSPLERIEALIVKELEADEAVRAALGTRPRPRHEAERCARTLLALTQTIERVQRLRREADSEAAETAEREQRDIDEFREELARRIRSFIDARKAEEAAKGGSAAGGETPDRDIDSL